MRDEEPPTRAADDNGRDEAGTVPPFAALTTIAAVMGSQNAPVKARSQSAWTDCLSGFNRA
jgi:hypothetical protein